MNNRSSKTRSLALPLLLVGTLAFTSAGCDAGPGGASEKQVSDLRIQAKKLEDDNRALMNRLETAERRIAGLSEDLASVNRTAVDASATANAAKAGGPAADGAPGAAPAAAGQTGSADPHADLSERDREIASFLDRDAGRKVLETAMKAVEAKQNQERQDRMVAGMIDAFAQKANLTPQQSESMRKIVGKSVADIRGLWDGMRTDMTPEERQSARTDAMAKMTEINTRTDDEMRGVLDSGQFATYQQDAERMRNGMRGMGGAPGGNPGGGGPGGMGGRRGQ